MFEAIAAADASGAETLWSLGDMVGGGPDPEVVVARTRERSLSARVRDLCTGSGCVAITLGRERPTTQVLATDLSEDALRAVPSALREGAYALGATKLEVSTSVVVPAALSGIVASFILAISRAIGETMAVTIAAGNLPNLTLNPFESIQTMTAYIVQVSLGDTPAGTLEYRTIFAVGMLLFVSTFALNLLSNWLRERFREEYA